MTAAGTLPRPGETVEMIRAASPITVVDRLGEGGQGVVYRARLDGGPTLALKWYRPTTASPQQRQAIADLVTRGTPHGCFSWPLDLVRSANVDGWGYVMPLISPEFAPFAQLLNDDVQPSFRVMASIGRQLAEAIACLHASGLCYRDLNSQNVYVDRERGAVAICDNDNVGTDRGYVAVYGTLLYMAPEVVRRETTPTTVTDLHSLAVLLFKLLMRGHPLEGRRVDALYSWNGRNHASDEEIAVQYCGYEPLFVFDPADDANRPVDGDPMLRMWPLYPGFVVHAFTQAFTRGLHDPSLGVRVTAQTWRKLFVRLGDGCFRCPACSANRIYDAEEPDKACWSCGRRTALPLALELPSHTVVLDRDAVLTPGHLHRNRDWSTNWARVESHPQESGRVVLRNLGDAVWKVHADGEEPKVVRPAQAFAVRPGIINFGVAQGRVRTLP